MLCCQLNVITSKTAQEKIVVEFLFRCMMIIEMRLSICGQKNENVGFSFASQNDNFRIFFFFSIQEFALQIEIILNCRN